MSATATHSKKTGRFLIKPTLLLLISLYTATQLLATLRIRKSGLREKKQNQTLVIINMALPPKAPLTMLSYVTTFTTLSPTAL